MSIQQNLSTEEILETVTSQNQLYENLIEALKPAETEAAQKFEALREEFVKATEPEREILNQKIQPALERADKRNGPARLNMEEKVEKIRARALRQIDDEVELYAKIQQDIRRQFDDETKAEHDEFNAAIADRKTVYDQKCDEVQKEFDAATAEYRENYLKLAKALEEKQKA